MHKTGEVVALVEILEHRAKDLGFLVRQGDAFCGGVHIAISQGMAEERTSAEDVFVGGKKTLFGANDQCNDG